MSNAQIVSHVPSAAVPLANRVWQRHTPIQKLLRFIVWFTIVLAVVQSVRHIEIIPEFLYDAPEQMQDMLGRMWPVDWEHYQSDVHAALVETLHIATLGTLLSIFLAIPFGLLVASNLTRNKGLNLFARVVLVASRSINSLVWALLFLAVFGPGAIAGTLAIAFRSIGFVGKMVGETIEQMPRGPIEALQAAGASKFSEIWYGYWPQLKPAFLSILLLRWDINVRESAVLGLVGAGGVGMALDTALNLFQWPRVATVLVSIFAIVVITEIVVTQIRKRVL
ncbi:phosphonate ABC transporter, permease protein PhnE [Noviherbaspirillum saxi]|uniref:Phosphonate ABC transporter, permease protein PhnE n=1 Tax=Noviherbaspirillum saxi TaxID=2320863 RepID=A0A3A3FQD4_9BURK|nr:phosphonate ABC transporter, permease protein PhnE [Noviherbaspirillum saxi]RJF95909.1 phosphonate ABC transporter, permease protein PhnE [Noviherbaspirillum saxi]